MARHDFDKGSKWLLQQYGKGILYLGGARKVRRCRALQAELVQPRKLPDGLLEVEWEGQKQLDHVLVEIATYPEKRVVHQAVDDLMLAYQHLRKLPDLLTLVLRPKGKLQVAGRQELQSPLQWSRVVCEWKVVELWRLPADELLAAGDVGLIPWVPLAEFSGPPETLLERCREQIEQQVRPKDQANLLAVSQIFAKLRFPQPEMLALLGGTQAMIESPLIQELMAGNTQENILEFLKARFGDVPSEVRQLLRSVDKERKLKQLVKHAAVCPDLESFREKLLR